jgi:hypothetical protein
MSAAEPDALDIALAKARHFARIIGQRRLYRADGRMVVEWNLPASPVVEDAALNPDSDDDITKEEDDVDER